MKKIYSTPELTVVATEISGSILGINSIDPNQTAGTGSEEAPINFGKEGTMDNSVWGSDEEE